MSNYLLTTYTLFWTVSVFGKIKYLKEKRGSASKKILQRDKLRSVPPIHKGFSFGDTASTSWIIMFIHQKVTTLRLLINNNKYLESMPKNIDLLNCSSLYDLHYQR